MLNGGSLVIEQTKALGKHMMFGHGNSEEKTILDGMKVVWYCTF